MLRVRDGGNRRRARLTIGIALAALCVHGGQAPGAVAASPAAEVRAYWTPERMREAIPIGPLAEGPAAARGGETIAKRVNHPRQSPNRTHGKVFFSDGPVDYVCSGTSLRAPSGSVVWSAGHCVYGGSLLGGGFFENWEFVPAYKNGKAPFGEWPAEDLKATRRWKNSNEFCPPGGLLGCGNVAHDFGAAVVSRTGGEKLQDAVGGRGIVFGAERDKVYRPFGYPQEAPFDGEHMYRCRSPYKGGDPSAGDPPPMRIRCDMTGGSSGGGWVTGSGDVASVVSYGYEGEPNNLYGPYQGGSARDLYDKVKGG